MQKSLAEEFMQIMRDNDIAPDSINFEITESAAMISNAAVTSNIYDFELHGISLSLDDYGTGYSNISYLYDMPFMIMKIDKSILWSAETNEKADITLENTYKMANRLHLKVVQEGVETEEQIKKLLKLGCDYFQGYYFSKPVEEEAFVKYVDNFEVPEVCNS
jgi:EAL domain-containing protein (putative c-di-GMP-specific phosphodiesterase class I)